MARRIRPRDAILEMKAYHPPLEGRAGSLRLDFNENTIGCSPKVVEFLKSQLDQGGLALYPEYAETRASVASFFGIEADRMMLTNGTDEAIQVLVNTFVDDGDEVISLRPSYAMYKFYSQIAGAGLVEIEYTKDTLEFPLEELLEQITATTRAVLISNPNNPTGAAVDLEGIERILRKAANAAVLIDEAYYEFCGITALRFIDEFPNLFVSRTFSKVFGMAGMRVGCIFSQPENIAYLRKSQSPYSVNMFAALAVRAAIEDTDYIRRYVTEVLAGRETIYVGLERLGIPYYESHGNFVLIRFGDRAIEVRDRLRDNGILVRDRSYELPGCVRVTVGTRDQVRQFLTELERIW